MNTRNERTFWSALTTIGSRRIRRTLPLRPFAQSVFISADIVVCRLLFPLEVLASTMASSLNFLAMPLEIRYQIYSHLLIHTYVVNLSAHRMVNPLRNGVVRACRQTLYEMTEYYYANNTFLLTQQSPPEIAPAILQRRLSGVQHLQVEIGDLTLSPTKRAFFLSSHMQQRCDWFLKNLRLAKGGQEGRFLKTLVAIDRCGTSIVSE